ncbi:hypothetical protein NSQ77_19820 [Oceanobacillus sp. FSL K6-2867]
MIFEMAIQFRVKDIKEGQKWYQSFTDPWGNHLGFFEYLDKTKEDEVHS